MRANRKLIAIRSADVADDLISQKHACFFDMGNDAPDPPDYTATAAASEKSAQLGKELGDAQLAEARRQYDENIAVVKPIVDAQTGLMKQSIDQGDEQYNYMKDTFRPVEAGLVKDATDFSTEGAKEKYARTAAADLEQQQSNEAAQTDRALSAAGVNPNSAKFVGLKRIQEISNAAARAGAVTNARDKADSLSFAKRMDVAGLSRNLTGASLGSYGLALSAGNSATSNQMAPGQALTSGVAQGTGTIMQGQGQKVQGLTSIMNAQTSYANSNQPADYGGALIGALGGIGSAALLSSDRRLKENIEFVGIDEGTNLPLYEFNYIGKPGTRFRGVMADEVIHPFPDAVTFDSEGFASVNYEKLGIEMREV